MMEILIPVVWVKGEGVLINEIDNKPMAWRIINGDTLDWKVMTIVKSPSSSSTVESIFEYIA